MTNIVLIDGHEQLASVILTKCFKYAGFEDSHLVRLYYGLVGGKSVEHLLASDNPTTPTVMTSYMTFFA